MVVQRRLLMGGGGSFTQPDYSTVALTTAQAGGWTQASDPHAVEHAGYVYFGYVNMANGNIEFRAWEIATGTVSSASVAHAALQTNTHCAPALLVRDADHKLITAYSQHNGTTIYVRVSANSLDSDPTLSGGWASEQNLDGTILASRYTYPTLIQLLGETDDPIYLFFRNATADLVTGELAFTKATDVDGAMWSVAETVWRQTSKSCYFELESDGNTRIDFACTDGPPGSGTVVSVYHFFYDGAWKTSAGVSMGSPAFDSSDATLVYNGAGGDAWAQDIDPAAGNPVMTYNVTGVSPSSHRFARWNGSAWVHTTIVAGPTFADPAPVSVLDHYDLGNVYLDQTVSGRREIWRYETTSFTGTAVTSGSSDDNLYPAAIRDSTVTERRVVWLYGSYTSDTVNSLGIKAGR